MRRALSLCVLCASCTTSELEVRGLESGDGVVAEVHLHQYAFGSHAAAGFLRTPVPYRRELDEELVNFLPEPVARDIYCRVDVSATCTPACDGAREYCDQSACRAYKPLQFLDGGPVSVVGSSVVSPLTLTFDPRIPGYRSGRPSTAPLFAEGDALSIEVPGGLWAYRVEVVAPRRPVVTTSLSLPSNSADLRVGWEPVGAWIAIRINVAGRTGGSGSIACAYDFDRGEAVIPGAFIARLPPPPRSVTFSVERFERRFPVIAPGKMAVVTVASTHVVDIEE